MMQTTAEIRVDTLEEHNKALGANHTTLKDESTLMSSPQ